MPDTETQIKVASDSHGAAIATAVAGPECALNEFPKEERFGVQLWVNEIKGTVWEFEVATARRMSTQNHPELPLDAELAGCALLIESREDTLESHHIWVIQTKDGQNYLDDGVFKCVECSAWAYPTNWNIGVFDPEEKAPIAAEFVDAKRHNMQENGYDWPIFVHTLNNVVLEFAPGAEYGAELPNNCAFSEPEAIEVTGLFDTESLIFNASIGAEDCVTIAWLDGSSEPEQWQGARDNVLFSSVEAWMMPSYWDQAKIDVWVASH